MEKYISSVPIINPDNEGGKALAEKNNTTDTNLTELEIIDDKVSEKCKTPQGDAKGLKIKKLKLKKRGEKRKFPDKSDSLKVKRKKKEEKLEINSLQNKDLSTDSNEITILFEQESSTPQSKSLVKVEGSTPTDNDSDVENNELPIKGKFSRKSKIIGNRCKDTLDILLKLDSDLLDSMDKSLKILKSHNLLNDRYISMDILSDLISLALKTCKTTKMLDFGKELSMIISKCVNELCGAPKRTKARKSLTSLLFSPMNKSTADEEVPSVSCVKTSDEVLEQQALENQELEETSEQNKTNSEEPAEKNEEPVLEISGNNFCITNYFKKLKRTVEERDKNERFSCFTTKTDMFLAPKLGGELTAERRSKFEEEFRNQNCTLNYLNEHNCKLKKRFTKQGNRADCHVETAKESSSADETAENSASEMEVTDAGNPEIGSTTRKRVSLIRVEKLKVEQIEAVGRTKAKLLQFHDNRRPPYWGTWRRKSESVGPRRPFGKDKVFNYEVDSDDEWEEEEEPGESLHGSDDEKEPEEDYEVDNEFFVPHGYLSDDENPEKENSIPKSKLDLLAEQFTSEQKQKTRKMTPIVFGTFWAYKDVPCEGTLYQDLQIDRLQYVPWTTTPVDVEEEKAEKSESFPDQEAAGQVKKPKRKIFPHEEIPNLIKMIHGSPQNCDRLARKFLLYWETEKIPNGNRPGLTKVCVQKKIKELAAWQASQEKGKSCWQVPKETREEFGAEVESKTPEKKPRKCFIWKFVRKAPKDPPGPGASPSEPVAEPEIILES